MRKKIYVLCVAALIGAAVASSASFTGSGKQPTSLVTTASLRSGSAVSAMKIFRSPSEVVTANLPSVLPARVQHALSDLPSPAQGAAIESKLRLVSLRSSADLYLFPTDQGSVCFVTSDRAGAASCVDQFDKNTPVGWILYRDAAQPATVVGVVPDNVASVDVTFGTEVVHATISSGAFIATSATTQSDEPVTVDVSYVDGSSVSQNAPPMPATPGR